MKEKVSVEIQKAYELNRADFVSKYLNIKVLLGVFTIGAFGYLDIFVTHTPNALLCRTPSLFLGISLVLFNVFFKEKYNLFKVVYYHLFFASLPLMMVGLLYVFNNEVEFGSVASGTTLVYIVLTMELNLKTRTNVVVYSLPILLYMVIKYLFLDAAPGEARQLSNLIPTVIFSLVLNYVQQKRSFDAFVARIQLDTQKKKIEDLYLSESEQNKILNQQNEEIVSQRDQIKDHQNKVEKSHKNLMDSINYARNIQEAVLPDVHFIKKHIPDFFIFNQPRNIVSGDFFWFKNQKNVNYIAAVDCTGHGVPGAFLSIIGGNILNRALFEKKYAEPHEILDFLSEKIHTVFQRKNKNTRLRDGMDIILCAFDFSKNTLRFSGVHNPLVLVRDGELQVFKTDRHDIGKPFTEKFTAYTQHEISLQEGDMVYIFSDGYADQFGGAMPQKLMAKRFREILRKIHTWPTSEQHAYLGEYLTAWKADESQTDDILIIGIRYVKEGLEKFSI